MRHITLRYATKREGLEMTSFSDVIWQKQQTEEGSVFKKRFEL